MLGLEVGEEHVRFLNFFVPLPDIHPEVLHKPQSLHEPDIIVIDVDEQQRGIFPHIERAEGKQASSMLRRLASADQGTSYKTELFHSSLSNLSFTVL